MRDKNLAREISCHLAAKVFMQAVEEGLVVRSLHSMNLVVLHICHSACKRCSKCKIHISIDTPIQNTACCGVSVTNIRFADHIFQVANKEMLESLQHGGEKELKTYIYRKMWYPDYR